MKLARYVLLAVLLIAPAAYALPPNAQLQGLVSQYLHTEGHREHISGVALTVLDTKQQRSETVYAGANAYPASGPRIDANSLFAVGSITKSYVSAILLQLAAEPQYHFSIDDPITKFFPRYHHWHAVTLRELMNMSSGIPDYITQDDFVTSLLEHPRATRSPRELVAYSYRAPLLFKPGTEWDYSNTNYILLGMVVEKLTGQSLASEMRTRLFLPLHLMHTYYAAYHLSPAVRRALVHAYADMRDSDIPLGTDVSDYSISLYGAAAGVIANTDDTARWVDDLFTPGKVLNATQLHALTSLISKRTALPLAIPSAADPMGFGLGIDDRLDPFTHQLVYGYEGMTLGSRAFYLYFPAKHIILAVAANSSEDGAHDHLYLLLEDAYAVTMKSR